MKLLRATQFSSLAAVFVVFAVTCSAQRPIIRTEAAANSTAGSAAPEVDLVRVFPGVQLSPELQLTYVGMFSPDAMFRACASTYHCRHRVPGEGIIPASPQGSPEPQRDAPAWMLLSTERIVENLEPHGHAQATLPAVSHPAELRNHFVTMIYGHPSVIRCPHHVATDSQHRLLVSDPDGSAIHVIDPNGKSSFRLTAGAGYRLHRPAGIAVDAHDNVYVADSEQGVLVVFDRNGNFVKYIGNYHGEPQYAEPRGIAIDPRKQQLFVVDTPRNLVLKLDLDGNVLRQLGKDHRGQGVGEFLAPTEIAINHRYIYILDRWGTRVQVWSLNLEPIGSFDLPGGVTPGQFRDNGLSADQDSHVYVSLFNNSLLAVYNPNGQLVSVFGQSGTQAGQFEAPAGLWIDTDNRLYVADSGNGRIQVFQLSPGK